MANTPSSPDHLFQNPPRKHNDPTFTKKTSPRAQQQNLGPQFCPSSEGGTSYTRALKTKRKKPMTSVIMHQRPTVRGSSELFASLTLRQDTLSGCCAENTLPCSTTKAELGELAATPPRNCQTRIILFLDVATTVAKKKKYKAKKKRKLGKQQRKFPYNQGKPQTWVFYKYFKLSLFLIVSSQIPSVHLSADVSYDGEHRRLCSSCLTGFSSVRGFRPRRHCTTISWGPDYGALVPPG